MKKSVLALAGGLAMLSAFSAHAVPSFVNKSFEDPIVDGETQVGTGTYGWNATAGGYRITDAVGAPDLDQYALFGDGNQLYQNLTFDAGSYLVNFYSFGTGTASVYEGLNLFQPVLNVNSGSFSSYSYQIDLASQKSLRLFFSNTGADGDMGLDKVVISGVTAAVPEPETYAMMLAGLGAIGFMARRRQSRR